MKINGHTRIPLTLRNAAFVNVQLHMVTTGVLSLGTLQEELCTF